MPDEDPEVRGARPGDLDAELTAYYAAEARDGRRVVQGDLRHDLRAGFRDLLRVERRSRLVDVGAGPGIDTLAWHRDGVSVVGVDLVVDNVVRMHALGLDGVAASLYDLPFPDGSFDALWTMSTFVHVPHRRFDDAITELLRVVRPGAPLGIGTWGGQDFEGHPEFGDLRPYRFFSLAGHDRWREMLARHAAVESFTTARPEAHHDWEYQFAVLRSPT